MLVKLIRLSCLGTIVSDMGILVWSSPLCLHSTLLLCFYTSGKCISTLKMKLIWLTHLVIIVAQMGTLVCPSPFHPLVPIHRCSFVSVHWPDHPPGLMSVTHTIRQHEFHAASHSVSNTTLCHWLNKRRDVSDHSELWWKIGRRTVELGRRYSVIDRPSCSVIGCVGCLLCDVIICIPIWFYLLFLCSNSTDSYFT